MNAIKMLKEDHRRISEMFRDYEGIGESAFKKKGEIADRIFHELEVHTSLEEEIFYPAVASRGGRRGQELVDESLEEHAEVKALIEEMKELDAQSSEFDDKMLELIEGVEHHVEQEEAEMFPHVESKLAGELDALGEEMEREKEMIAAG